MSAIDKLRRHAGGPALVSSRTLRQLAREIADSAPVTPSSMSPAGAGFSFDLNGRSAPARMTPPQIPDGVIIMGVSAVKKLHAWMRPRLLARPSAVRPGGSLLSTDAGLSGSSPSAAFSGPLVDVAGIAARADQMRPLSNSRSPRP